MPRYYESSAALCPFYKGEGTTKVICEGAEEGEWMIRNWKRNAAEYKQKYCRASWQKCPVAKMLYERE